VAHYARNKDYHFWFKEKLQQYIQVLKQHWPDENFLAFTDAVPLLERDHAMQAGLGWVGKNTCLIHPKKGSLFFIGEILCSFDCSQSFLPMHDFCGSCRACIDVCPTGALDTPRVLDSNKCIAYWNIESRSLPPEPIREKMEAWFFGCDLCQTVCPWNMKLFKNDKDFQQEPGDEETLVRDLTHILSSSNKALLREVRDTPLSRAGGRGLKRNALIVIANLRLTSLSDLVEGYVQHETLAELAQWTLKKLKT
jgi:epoxyqueuosine reductase